MTDKQILLLPGPTPVPPQVALAMARPAINHRGPEFKALWAEVTSGLKDVFQTRAEVVILTASGTGGMEAAVANLISPGEKVLVVTIGAFGERFVQICRAFNVEAEVVAFPYGQAADPEVIAERLAADTGHEIKAILVQHNETSTGVLNDIQAISRARGDHPALLIVDSISGLAAADLPMDAWHIDVVIAGSQKAFMLPPGLTMLAVGERAWQAAEKCSNQRFYLDIKKARNSGLKGQTPFTPAVPLLYGLQESLRLLKAETLAGSYARHALMRDMVRAGVRALGLKLLADEAIASPAVTAVCVPEGMKPADIINPLRERFGVVVAGGQGAVKDQVFRIGHLGYVSFNAILAGLAALEAVLADAGVPVTRGAAVAAASTILSESEAVDK
ncbi:class V aminotransferase [Moorella thermoacetica]|uniref:Tritium exchange subunit n=2 Tax=Neomoorella thermoacetica TaxID=1525 RepID=A0AAC9HES6_NEOTH|nr:alanine--glyoxylate aminotransferase family protein [Moorella thermoacetica]AOQ22519.1 Soluble hydrogenase 42 kDa subunit [Moorella thermoacetica]TYL13236.1 Soluble hydrogenase 42 kDa subunit [Moorella thermoacetica]GLI16911.1 class V aminotransferase [Moorella thermoacetica]